MSEYSYDSRPRRGGSRRTRDRDPEYVQETSYMERGAKGAPAVRDLVYRPREDSIEDIHRDFPPPGAEYRQTRYRESYEPQRARSVGRRGYDDRSDYGYSQSSRGKGRRSDYDRDGYYSDDYDKPRRERRKSVVDNIKEVGEGLGLGGVIAAVTGKKSRSRSRSRHGGREYDSDRYDGRSRRYSDESRSRSRSRGGSKKTKKWEQAAQAAAVAGVIEAWRSRKEPGPWTGQKGQRIATAALGAAGIDSLVDKDPDRKGKRHVAEAAIGGLIANRVANGSRSQSRGRGRSTSRSRSRSASKGGIRARSRSLFGRSQSRGRDGGDSHTLRDVAGAGAVLAAGKALYNRVRSKSRQRKEKDRSRSRSVSSEDSYVPSRARNYKDRNSRDFDFYDGASRNSGSQNRTVANKGGRDSDSESTDDMEQKRKKLRGHRQQAYPTTYADANPYGSVPPPPLGAPSSARY
jgi:hypothetical protein